MMGGVMRVYSPKKGDKKKNKTNGVRKEKRESSV